MSLINHIACILTTHSRSLAVIPLLQRQSAPRSRAVAFSLPVVALITNQHSVCEEIQAVSRAEGGEARVAALFRATVFVA